MTTDRQTKYCQARAAGHAQKQAAIMAGYASGSAAQQASRLERNPAVAERIEELRAKDRPPAADEPKFETAEAYLQAVVRGDVVPDPARIGAARCLIVFQSAKKRGPIQSPAPKRLAEREVISDEATARAEWLAKSAAVREKHARAKQEKP